MRSILRLDGCQVHVYGNLGRPGSGGREGAKGGAALRGRTSERLVYSRTRQATRRQKRIAYLSVGVVNGGLFMETRFAGKEERESRLRPRRDRRRPFGDLSATSSRDRVPVLTS